MGESDEASYGYQSAMDMPTFLELKKHSDGFALLGFLMKKEDRAALRALKNEMKSLADTVDKFYEVLGSRQWIFHDRLPISLVRENVLSAGSSGEAERALCAIYDDPERMKFMVMPMARFPEIRARESLVAHARRDFEEKRYYAVVLTLLTVMDGFVNDIQNVRRGLHARQAEELQSWDTAVGHHMGLTSTQASFRKSYSRRIDDEFFDLARNGILHGNITSYNNIVVASKAWNRLFAVVDWAASLEKESTPKEPDPTWPELIERLKENADFKVKLEDWAASSGVVESEGDYEMHTSTIAASEFLNLWMRSNWGHLATHFMLIGKGDAGKATPKEVKSAFGPYKLEGFQILSYETQAPSIAEVQVELRVGGEFFPAVLRMTYTAEDGNTRVEGSQEGAWKIVFRSPEVFSRGLVKVAKY